MMNVMEASQMPKA